MKIWPSPQRLWSHPSARHKTINATGKKNKKTKKDKPVKQKKSKKEKKALKEVIDEPVDDGYDGYYNDVLPPDLDRVKEGLDKELVKKVVAVAVGVVFIISMCVVMLYTEQTYPEECHNAQEADRRQDVPSQRNCRNRYEVARGRLQIETE